VETVSAHAQEVTEDFVDLEARIANARRLEERLIALLQSSTGKLPDIMQAERELARVRTEIELHEGRLRRLKDRVSFGTMRIDLHEPKPLVPDNPGEDGIRAAFKQAARERARVRTEIELHEGRLRRLKDRVSFGTIRIDLHEPKPLVSDNPGENVIRSAFKQAWRNFVRTIAKGIALSGILLPVLVV